jgi:hypothetical protein
VSEDLPHQIGLTAIEEIVIAVRGELDALIPKLEERKKLLWSAETKPEFNLPQQQIVDYQDLHDAINFLKLCQRLWNAQA